MKVILPGDSHAGPFRTEDHTSVLDAQLRQYALEIGTLYRRSEQQRSELEAATLAVVNAFIIALGAHDPYTRDHTSRVQHLALATARLLDFDDGRLEDVRLGSVLHDIGKISVSDSILRKPTRLSEQEYEDIRRHPSVGWLMIESFPALQGARNYVLYHHERWDGSGYPHGLQGDAIPIEGRLLAVVDAYDAMTSDRSYRPGRPPAEAVQELLRVSGTQLDPQVVQAFIAALRRETPPG